MKFPKTIMLVLVGFLAAATFSASAWAAGINDFFPNPNQCQPAPDSEVDIGDGGQGVGGSDGVCCHLDLCGHEKIVFSPLGVCPCDKKESKGFCAVAYINLTPSKECNGIPGDA